MTQPSPDPSGRAARDERRASRREERRHRRWMEAMDGDDAELERIARKRAGSKLGWYAHAAMYVLVNLVLFAISQYAFGTRRWSVFPLLGWGLGLALHGVSVFILGNGSGLRERLVERERERLLRERGGR